MKEIKLANSDKVAIVDDEDYDKVIQVSSTWYLHNGYAQKGFRKGSKIKTRHLHRLVLNLMDDTWKDESVDHINHNKLDNRKSNLRICTYAQNIKIKVKLHH